ncbi:MAG: RluA family pseudouridine synthase [Rhodothermales bacterium]|nr:RluA family pseudouridine synthase [Rhodothermales bacterium]
MKKLRLPIVYSDDDVLVIEKPAGILSIPDRYDPKQPHIRSVISSKYKDTLVVHRLDRDTSGIMVLAQNADSHRHLNELFQNGTVRKVYTAIIHGHLLTPEVTIDLSLKPDGDRRHRTVVDKSAGKGAVTHFASIDRYRDFSQITAVPETGRTHQIRAHLSAIKCPIVCDELYGTGRPLMLSEFKHNYTPSSKREERPLIGRLALHSTSLTFTHPTSGEKMQFNSELPKDFRASINQLSKYGR